MVCFFLSSVSNVAAFANMPWKLLQACALFRITFKSTRLFCAQFIWLLPVRDFAFSVIDAARSLGLCISGVQQAEVQLRAEQRKGDQLERVNLADKRIACEAKDFDRMTCPKRPLALRHTT